MKIKNTRDHFAEFDRQADAMFGRVRNAALVAGCLNLLMIAAVIGLIVAAIWFLATYVF